MMLWAVIAEWAKGGTTDVVTPSTSAALTTRRPTDNRPSIEAESSHSFPRQIRDASFDGDSVQEYEERLGRVHCQRKVVLGDLCAVDTCEDYRNGMVEKEEHPRMRLCVMRR